MNRLLLLVLSFILLSACEKKEEYFQPATGSAGAKPAPAAAQDKEAQQRKAWVAQLQRDMDELDAKLADLKRKAQTLSGQAKVELDRQIHNLEREQKVALQKLNALKSATGETWDQLKADVTEAVERFKRSVRKAVRQ